MTNAIPVADWLNHLDREYLSTFIKEGGAAVKFAVTAEKDRRPLVEELKNRCNAQNHLLLELDAINHRLHMPQDIFFGMASQVDWRLLARKAILQMLAENSCRVTGIDPNDSVNIIDAVVARTERADPQQLRYELRPILASKIAKNKSMSKSFRVAMTHLCILESNSNSMQEYSGKPLLEWMTGTNTRISNIRPFQVHTPINRTTARYFIESALHWVRLAGYSGTVILLDNTRVTIARNPRDGKRYYTRPMTMDHYELLRELIDDVDRLQGALMIVLTDYAFVDEHSPRSWAMYPALRTRVMDDVRDRNIANPVAALVRLS